MSTTQSLGNVIRTARRLMKSPETGQPPMSQRELGLAVNSSRLAVINWETKGARPEHETLLELQRVLGVNLTDHAYSGHDIPLSAPRKLGHNETRRVPVIFTRAHVQRGSVGFWVGEEIVDRVELPARLAARTDIRAIKVKGQEMAPRYKNDETIFVGNAIKPRTGDYVFITLLTTNGKGSNGHAPLRIGLVREYLGRTGSKLKLRQLNPVRTHSIDVSKIHLVERVVPLDELLPSG